MKITYQSINKADAANEDRALCRQHLLAISDGAGGTGIYAGEWADYLLQHLPMQPLHDGQAVQEWLQSIWENFYNEFSVKAEESRFNLSEKFVNEGSAATLVALWLNPNDTAQANYLRYGDSVLLQWLPDGSLHSFGATFPDLFLASPQLLNWTSNALPEAAHCGEITLPENSVTLLVSDTLAQFLMAAHWACLGKEEVFTELLKGYSRLANYSEKVYEVFGNKNFKVEILQPLLQSLASEEKFRAWSSQYLAAGLLGYDDYTAVALEMTAATQTTAEIQPKNKVKITVFQAFAYVKKHEPKAKYGAKTKVKKQ